MPSSIKCQVLSEPIFECPSCAGELEWTQTPYWPFPIVTCSDCLFLGNECSLVAYQNDQDYIECAKKLFNPVYEYFAHMQEEQKSIKEQIALGRMTIEREPAALVRAMAHWGLQKYATDWRMTDHFSLQRQRAGYNWRLGVSFFAAPLLLSHLRIYTPKMIKRRAVHAALGYLQGEDGLHCFSNAKKLVVFDDPELAFRIHGLNIEQTESARTPIAIFDPKKTVMAFEAFKLTQIVIAATTDPISLLPRLSYLQGRLKIAEISPDELYELSSQTSVLSALEELEEQAVSLDRYMAKKTLEAHKRGLASHFLDVHEFDETSRDAIVATAQNREEQETLRSVFESREESVFYHGNRIIYRQKEGGFKTRRKRSRKIETLSNFDIRLIQIIQYPNSVEYRGFIRYKGNSYPISFPKSALAPRDGMNCFRRRFQELDLPIPYVQTTLYKAWVEAILYFSRDAEIVDGYTDLRYIEGDDPYLVLPNLIISPDDIKKENRIFTRNKMIGFKAPRPKIRLESQISLHLNPTRHNYSLWAGIVGMSLLFGKFFFDIEHDVTFFIGNKESFGHELFELTKMVLHMPRKRRNPKNYPIFAAEALDSTSISFGAPFEAYGASLMGDYHFVSGLLGKKLNIEPGWIRDLIFYSFQKLFNSKLGPGQCYCFECGLALYKTASEILDRPAKIIQEAMPRFYCHSFLSSGTGYNHKSLAARFLSLVFYLSARDMAPDDSVEIRDSEVSLDPGSVTSFVNDSSRVLDIKIPLPMLADSFQAEQGLIRVDRGRLIASKAYCDKVLAGWEKREELFPTTSYG